MDRSPSLHILYGECHKSLEVILSSAHLSSHYTEGQHPLLHISDRHSLDTSTGAAHPESIQSLFVHRRSSSGSEIPLD